MQFLLAISQNGFDVYRTRSLGALIKRSLPNVIRRRRIFLFRKRNAPSPFTSRLPRCRFTFTKPPIPPNRSVPSRLSKASTTSRFAATRKLAKERGVGSRVVTTFLFAENLLVL